MVAVGAIVESRTNDRPSAGRSEFLISLAWTCSAGGAVSGIPTINVTGVLSRVTFVPGSGGSQPTNLYDVTLLDDNNIDVLAGLGANLSNAAPVDVAPMLGAGTNVPVVVVGTLQLTIANAGNAKTGTACLYFRRGGP